MRNRLIREKGLFHSNTWVCLARENKVCGGGRKSGLNVFHSRRRIQHKVIRTEKKVSYDDE